MRVLWLIDALDCGGAERLAALFLRQRAGRGAPTALVSLRHAPPNAGEIERELAAAGVAWSCLEARHLRDLAAWRRLSHHLTAFQPDLVHAHLTYATLWGGWAARRRGLPFLATLHVLPAGAGASPRARILQAAEISTLNCAATRVLALSETQGAAWVAAGLRPRLLRVVPNGCAAPAATAELRVSLRARLGIPPEAMAFLTVAVVRAEKGWRLWLEKIPEIVAQVPQAAFVWVGDGPEGHALRHEAARSPFRSRIVLAGMQPEIDPWLAAADIFLFPSRREAQPTAVLEAMAARLPIVAFALPAIAEVLGAPSAAWLAPFLAPPEDSTAWVAAARSLALSPEARRACAATLRARFDERFSAACWIERLENEYAAVREAMGGAEPSAASPRRARRGRQTDPAAVWMPGAPRILMVEFFSRGGLFHYAAQLATALQERGAAVKLLTAREPELAISSLDLEPVLATWNPRRATRRLWRHPLRMWHGVLYLRAWFQVLRRARQLQPNVVLFGDLEHRCDAWFTAALRHDGFRLADIVHNLDSFDRWGRHRLWRGGAGGEPWREAMLAAIPCLFVHAAVLQNEWGRRTGQRMTVIHHGNEDLFREQASPEATLHRLALPDHAVVALLFGTLTKYKGVAVFLAALAHLPPRQRPLAVIAGFPAADSDLAAWQALAQRLGIAASLRWDPRYIPVPEVAGYFRRADFVVLPYLGISQSGVAHLAFSFSKPVIASAVGGLRELIIPESNGLLVPPGDAPALAQAIARLTGDAPLRAAMGRQAGVHRSWDDAAREILATLSSRFGVARSRAAPLTAGHLSPHFQPSHSPRDREF